MEQDSRQLLAMKSALMATTSTAGWDYIKKFAETVVRDMEKKAIAEDDDSRANGLRRDAKGARAFMEDLFRRIEIAKHLDQPTEGEDFLEVTMD